MKTESDFNAFQRLWLAGYRYLVPIVPPDAELSPRSRLFSRPKSRGKAPGERNEVGLWRSIPDWQTATPDEPQLERWFRMGAGVGIRTGLQHDGSYIYAVDADTLHEISATVIRAKVETLFGELPTRIGQAPKALYLIRCDGPLPYQSLVFLHGVVEVLGQGKQFVAVGIHSTTGKPYNWTRHLVALEEMRVRPASEIVTLLESLREVLDGAGEVYAEGGRRADTPQNGLVGDLDTVSAALDLIPNVYRPGGYPQWIKMAAAVRGAAQDDYERGKELFCDWSAKADVPDATEDPAQAYRSVKAPFSVGAGWLYELAEAADATGRFTKASALTAQWFDAERAAEQPETGIPVSAIVKAARPKLELIRFDDAADSALTQSNKPLVKGLLDMGAMTVLYGESNAGKTFVTMDLAYHVAAGLPWGGMRTTQGVVVYVAAEGGTGARKRAAALRARYGACGAFLFVLCPVDLRDPAADLKPLLDLLAPVEGLVLVVVDTLSRAMAGGDENSSVDMGAMVRHFDVLRAVTAAHLIVVHHTGKDLAKGARGHSLLRAATDTEIEVVEGGISVTKQRDLEKEWRSGFELESVTLGVNELGDVVTSATLKLVEGVVLARPDRMAVALENVRTGEWRKDIRAGESWVGHPIASGLGLPLDTDSDKDRIKQIVTAWLKEGRLVEELRVNKARQSKVYVTVPSSIFD